MGRGRAKAKQIKVARKLKYSAPSTDLTALERELHGGREDSLDDNPEVEDSSEEEDDPYAGYAPDEDEDDYEAWAAGGHR